MSRSPKDSSRSDQAESKEKETIPVIGEKKKEQYNPVGFIFP